MSEQKYFFLFHKSKVQSSKLSIIKYNKYKVNTMISGVPNVKNSFVWFNDDKRCSSRDLIPFNVRSKRRNRMKRNDKKERKELFYCHKNDS